MNLIEHLSRLERIDNLLYRPDGTLRSDIEVEAVIREAKKAQNAEFLPDQEAVDMVLATESCWLRNAKAEQLRRDPVDAINDTEALLTFLQFQFDASFLLEGQRQSADR